MHNKLSDVDDENRSMRKSRSTSNLSIITKKKSHHLPTVKIEVHTEDKLEHNKSSPTGNRTNGHTSPNNHRRRPKRSSINSNALLSTVSSVHEFMSFVIYKDDPPSWLKQTDLYKEYTDKSEQLNTEDHSAVSPIHYPQQFHRKQRCNLQMYARPGHSWQALSSPPLLNASTEKSSFKTRNHSNESLRTSKRDMNRSPIRSSSSMMDLSTPLNISVKQEPIEQNLPSITNKTKLFKQQPSTITTRRQHLLCKKKLPHNGIRRRQCMNSLENQELSEKKDSSISSQNDSNTSTMSSSSSIEHASPSPTTTISESSSRRSSPTEYMRGSSSINTRLSSPLRIRTSFSPQSQPLSTAQRRSTRIWAPSSFYINPMWILPNATPSKRLLLQNTSSSPSPSSESPKRPRRRCRS